MYRLIHTSDWHLGQHFRGQTRELEHRLLVAWLLEQVQRYQVDAVLIAGDLFDTVSPPSYARQQYHHLLDQLKQQGCQCLILGGNHDSVAVLSELKPLAHHIGAYILPTLYDTTLDAQIVTLQDRDGQPAALLCAVPYIRPRDVMTARDDLVASSKEQALLTAITQHYQRVYEAARAKAATLGQPDLPIIGTGHLTAAQASKSGDERELYIGTLHAVPLSAFPPFDYLALGHIHRPQVLQASPPIIYSGAPFPVSFSESQHAKQMQLIEIENNALHHRALEVPRFQRLVSVQGGREAVFKQVKQLVQQADTLLADHQCPTIWLHVQIETSDAPQNLQHQLNEMIAEAPIRLLTLERVGQIQALSQALPQLTLDEITHDQVFARRLAATDLTEEEQAMLQVLYAQTVAGLTDEMP